MRSNIRIDTEWARDLARAADLRAAERQYILDDELWPAFPFLPLVKRTGDLMDKDKCALIHAGNKTRVYFGDVFIGAGASPKSRDFESIDALLAEYRID